VGQALLWARRYDGAIEESRKALEIDPNFWLDVDARTLDLVREVLRPYPSGEMVGYPVGAGVNSPRNQGEGLIEQSPVNSA